jgi:hypothetical protein
VHHRCRWSAGDQTDTSMMLAVFMSDIVPCIREDDEHLRRASHSRHQRVRTDLHTFGAKFQYCAAITPEVSPQRTQMGTDTSAPAVRWPHAELSQLVMPLRRDFDTTPVAGMAHAHAM